MAIRQFYDGVTSLFSDLVNRRAASNNNAIKANRVDDDELKQIYRTGLGSKIIRLKAGQALKDSIQFDTKEDQTYYEARLAKQVRQAAKFMLGFGRGLVVIHEPGADLAQPLRSNIDPALLRFRTFSGDMVNVPSVSFDLNDPNYLKPLRYHIRGFTIHHTRAVDFRYYEPVETDAPEYRYGGISEFELIYKQLINDGIVERASPTILEKNSSFFYKVKDFKSLLMQGKEKELLKFFGKLEDMRSIYGAGIIDAEDSVEAVGQALTNLAEADQITLRRLAMVTGIPLAMLVGENVKGLNSTGDNERQVFQDMVEALQNDYLLDPINELMRKTGQGRIWFKENQGETPTVRVGFEKQVIENAYKLWEMGEDHRTYLEDKDIVKKDAFAKFFEPPEETDDGE